MNDCCNGSSEQKECCKAAVEAYKQEVKKQEVVGQLRSLQNSFWACIFIVALLVPVALIVHRSLLGNFSLVGVFIFLLCVMIWQKGKEIKALKQYIASKK